jgi:putative ubiquitin-RnfH superfamily antitoxin RatB of RatAB toxin-antitoxin module
MRLCAAPPGSTVPDDRLPVSVAYALRDRQELIELEVPAGTTAREAVERSGIRARCPEIAEDAPLGIHGRAVGGGERLAAGDRVEIYRRLPADPKDTRRRLAREGRTMGSRR